MQIVKNFLYNISYQLLVILLPLITVPYVSGILGSKGIGDYAFTSANTQYFILFGMIGITLYGNREIAFVRDNKEKLKETFFSIYVLQLITTSIASILFLVFVFCFAPKNYFNIYLIQGLNIIAAMLDISWLLIGLEQFKKTVFRNTIVKLVSLASIFIFVKNPEDTIIYTLILSLSNLLGNLSFWLYIPRLFGFKNIRLQDISLHFRASLALFVPQIAIQVYLLLDRTLLGILSNTNEVGYYENSQKLVKITLTIATAIGTVMMPKISNTIAAGEMKKVKYYIRNSFFFCSALAIPLMFGLMGIVSELSPWFFTDEFIGIDKLIFVSALIILPISWSNVIGIQLMIPLNKVKEFTISVTIGAIVNFTLNLFLIKKFGALGACLSTVCAEFSVTFIQLYVIREIISLKQLIAPTLMFFPGAIVMFIILRMIGNYLASGFTTNIIQVFLGAGVYFTFTLFVYRIIYKDSFINYVKGLIKS